MTLEVIELEELRSRLDGMPVDEKLMLEMPAEQLKWLLSTCVTNMRRVRELEMAVDHAEQNGAESVPIITLKSVLK